MRHWHIYRQSTGKHWIVVSRVRQVGDDFCKHSVGFADAFFRLCIPEARTAGSILISPTSAGGCLTYMHLKYLTNKT